MKRFPVQVRRRAWGYLLVIPAASDERLVAIAMARRAPPAEVESIATKTNGA
jgi:hypothetical protein